MTVGNPIFVGNESQLDSQGSLNLFAIVSDLWRYKWLALLTIALCIGLALGYIHTAASWYRVEVLLKPTDTRSSQGLSSQLGGALASIAGIDVNSNISAEPIAVLKSNELTSEFIQEQDLLPVLFPSKWDSSKKQWKSSDPMETPDVRDGVRYFDKKVRKVTDDRKTGLVTLSVEWTNAKTAADWANLLIGRVNDHMRNRALAEAQYNVDYLEHELAASGVVTLQQSIGRVLESELQKLMLAKGNKEFAFRVIDHAQVPKYRTWPDRVLILSLAFIIGFVLVIFGLVARQTYFRRKGFPG